MKEDILIGRNPIYEALRANKRKFNKIILSDGVEGDSINKIILLTKEKNINTEYQSKNFLDNQTNYASHQGIIAYVSAKEFVLLEDVFDIIEKKNELPFLIMVDQIEDPHNLGAILRTVEAVGAHAVIMPQKHQVSLTQAVTKTSAGALEYVNVVQVVNIAETIKILKKNNIWVIGVEKSGTINYWKQNFKIPLCLVIGSEAKGLRRLTQENSDILVKIPLLGKVDSLNASVAASIVMYEVLKQRLA
ncbi:MAG: 23S rRNA (guanosine(2251)-2'-O)-methyltransferase RlmB [bacterium]